MAPAIRCKYRAGSRCPKTICGCKNMRCAWLSCARSRKTSCWRSTTRAAPVEIHYELSESEAATMAIRPPDIEAEIRFISAEKGGRASAAISGYRPSHDFGHGGMLDAAHEYIGCESVA